MTFTLNLQLLLGMDAPMIRTIVTPIDGSVHAQMALELGTDLATKYDARIVLMHVVTRDDNVSEKIYEPFVPEIAFHLDKFATGSSQHLPRSNVLEHVGHMLLRSAQEHAKLKGVKHVETVIDTGDAGKRILHYAKSESADLIVMGSRGLGKLKGLVLGSVSHKVFHLAPCSCITVHSTGKQSAFEGVDSILVPTDGSEQADKAVDLASDIAAKYGAKLTLVYAMWRGPSLEELRGSIDMKQLSAGSREELDALEHPIAEHVSSALIPPVVSSGVLREIGQQVLARAKQTAEAKGVPATKSVLKDGDPARKIVQIAKREKVDLIAMGSRGLGGAAGLLAGSVSYKVNHTAPCSCLIVR